MFRHHFRHLKPRQQLAVCLAAVLLSGGGCDAGGDEPAVDPARIKRLARTSVYASMIHCGPDRDVCRSARSDGSAMFTIVLSSPTMNKLMQQIARMSMRLRWLTSGT